MTQPTIGRHAPLVLVVGPDTIDRTAVARTVLSRGNPVVLCGGPPSCPLLREESCPIVESADLAVMMPPVSHERKVIAGLAMCAARARHVVLAESQEDTDDDYDDGMLDPDRIADRVHAIVGAREGFLATREVSS